MTQCKHYRGCDVTGRIPFPAVLPHGSTFHNHIVDFLRPYFFMFCGCDSNRSDIISVFPFLFLDELLPEVLVHLKRNTFMLSDWLSVQQSMFLVDKTVSC